MSFIELTTLPRLGLLAATLLVSANADPKLRLTQTAVEVSIAVGSNGPAQTVDAFNAGDGSLAPQVSSTASGPSPASEKCMRVLQTVATARQLRSRFRPPLSQKGVTLHSSQWRTQRRLMRRSTLR